MLDASRQGHVNRLSGPSDGDEPKRRKRIANRGEAVRTTGPGSRDTGSGQDRESDDMDVSPPGSTRDDDSAQDDVELPTPAAILRFMLLPANEIAFGQPADQ
jgi:hypothetical protein